MPAGTGRNQVAGDDNTLVNIYSPVCLGITDKVVMNDDPPAFHKLRRRSDEPVPFNNSTA